MKPRHFIYLYFPIVGAGYATIIYRVWFQ